MSSFRRRPPLALQNLKLFSEYRSVDVNFVVSYRKPSIIFSVSVKPNIFIVVAFVFEVELQETVTENVAVIIGRRTQTPLGNPYLGIDSRIERRHYRRVVDIGADRILVQIAVRFIGARSFAICIQTRNYEIAARAVLSKSAAVLKSQRAGSNRRKVHYEIVASEIYVAVYRAVENGEAVAVAIYISVYRGVGNIQIALYHDIAEDGYRILMYPRFAAAALIDVAVNSKVFVGVNIVFYTLICIVCVDGVEVFDSRIFPEIHISVDTESCALRRDFTVVVVEEYVGTESVLYIRFEVSRLLILRVGIIVPIVTDICSVSVKLPVDFIALILVPKTYESARLHIEVAVDSRIVAGICDISRKIILREAVAAHRCVVFVSGIIEVRTSDIAVAGASVIGEHIEFYPVVVIYYFTRIIIPLALESTGYAAACAAIRTVTSESLSLDCERLVVDIERLCMSVNDSLRFAFRNLEIYITVYVVAQILVVYDYGIAVGRIDNLAVCISDILTCRACITVVISAYFERLKHGVINGRCIGNIVCARIYHWLSDMYVARCLRGNQTRQRRRPIERIGEYLGYFLRARIGLGYTHADAFGIALVRSGRFETHLILFFVEETYPNFTSTHYVLENTRILDDGRAGIAHRNSTRSANFAYRTVYRSDVDVGIQHLLRLHFCYQSVFYCGQRLGIAVNKIVKRLYAGFCGVISLLFAKLRV